MIRKSLIALACLAIPFAVAVGANAGKVSTLTTSYGPYTTVHGATFKRTTTVSGWLSEDEAAGTTLTGGPNYGWINSALKSPQIGRASACRAHIDACNGVDGGRGTIPGSSSDDCQNWCNGSPHCDGTGNLNTDCVSYCQAWWGGNCAP